MDAGSIAGVVGSIKAASDIAQAMLKLRDARLIQEKVIELNGVILAAQGSALAAQASQSALLDRIRELEGRLVEAEDWSRQKERYERKNFGCETFAHVLKPDMAEGETPHRVCTHCYEEGRISTLQHRHHNRGQEVVSCKTHGNINLGCPGELPTHTNIGRTRRKPIYG